MNITCELSCFLYFKQLRSNSLFLISSQITLICLGCGRIFFLKGFVLSDGSITCSGLTRHINSTSQRSNNATSCYEVYKNKNLCLPYSKYDLRSSVYSIEGTVIINKNGNQDTSLSYAVAKKEQYNKNLLRTTSETIKEEFRLLEKSHEIGYDQKFKKHFSPDEKYKSLIQAESLLLDLEKQLFHSKLLSKFSTEALLAFATSNQTLKTSQNIDEYSSLSFMEQNEEHETSTKSDKNNNDIDDSLSIMIDTNSEGEISDVDKDEIYENVDNNNPLS